MISRRGFFKSFLPENKPVEPEAVCIGALNEFYIGSSHKFIWQKEVYTLVTSYEGLKLWHEKSDQYLALELRTGQIYFKPNQFVSNHLYLSIMTGNMSS